MNKNQFKKQNQTHNESRLLLASFNQVASERFVVALFLHIYVHFALCASVLCSAHEQGLKHLSSEACTRTITVHTKLSALIKT